MDDIVALIVPNPVLSVGHYKRAEVGHSCLGAEEQSGEDGLRTEYAAQPEAPNPPKTNLTPCVLEYDYDLFGTLHAAS